MRYSESVVDLIGNTPLVRLRRVTAGIRATVLAKVEYFNPGGSVKDRIAVRMVEAAERDGLLRPGLGRVDVRVSASPIRDALAKLPPREAAAVMLRYYHGYSRAETAQILNLTERAVSLRLAKAQAILVRELGDNWNDDRPLHPAAPSGVIRDEETGG